MAILPPEQMHLGQCFPCSDLYALGVTAIVLLTGKYPRDLIDRDSLAWRWQTYANPAPELASILDRLLRQKPKERFQSARQVLEALAQADVWFNPDSPGRAEPRSSAPTSFVSEIPEPPPLPLPQVNEAFLTQCRRELTHCIGPMASFVLEDALEQHPGATAAELVHLIAAQLSDGDQATAFVSHIQVTADPLEASPPDSATLSLEPLPPVGREAGAMTPFLGLIEIQITTVRCLLSRSYGATLLVPVLPLRADLWGARAGSRLPRSNRLGSRRWVNAGF